MAGKYSGINIRKAHPGLYQIIMVLSLTNIALACNFWLYKPTFNPYGWHKSWIGLVFFCLGCSQIAFLNVIRDLRMVRVVLAASISWTFFWGLSNTQQFFMHKASLQLPILYVAISILQIPMLIEAPVNPVTAKKQ